MKEPTSIFNKIRNTIFNKTIIISKRILKERLIILFAEPIFITMPEKDLESL